MRPGIVSIMPQGLDEQMTKQELADLMAFLKATKWERSDGEDEASKICLRNRRDPQGQIDLLIPRSPLPLK